MRSLGTDDLVRAVALLREKLVRVRAQVDWSRLLRRQAREIRTRRSPR